MSLRIELMNLHVGNLLKYLVWTAPNTITTPHELISSGGTISKNRSRADVSSLEIVTEKSL